MVADDGIEPSTSPLSGVRSASELNRNVTRGWILPHPNARFVKTKESTQRSAAISHWQHAECHVLSVRDATGCI